MTPEDRMADSDRNALQPPSNYNDDRNALQSSPSAADLAAAKKLLDIPVQPEEPAEADQPPDAETLRKVHDWHEAEAKRRYEQQKAAHEAAQVAQAAQQKSKQRAKRAEAASRGVTVKELTRQKREAEAAMSRAVYRAKHEANGGTWCAECGGPIHRDYTYTGDPPVLVWGPPSKATYCGDPCRQKAYRKRLKATGASVRVVR